MNIAYSDISVVIQGAIDWSIDEKYLLPTTYCLTRRVRELMPEAEIILSTWRGQRTAGLLYDRIIESEDPGGQGAWPGFTINNVNRQIRSTMAGLNATERKYSLKIRSDMIIDGLKFLDEFCRAAPILVDKRAFFKNPIISNNISSRNTVPILRKFPDHPLLFHPSDHVHFGNSSDLIKLWDIPFQNESDAFYFFDRTLPNKWRAHELSRLAPEQHILTSSISRNSQLLDVRDYGVFNHELFDLSEYYLSTHFRFLPDLEYPVRFAKYHTDHHFKFFWMRRNDGVPDAYEHDATQQSHTGMLSNKFRLRSLVNRMTFPFRKPIVFYGRVISGYYRRPK